MTSMQALPKAKLSTVDRQFRTLAAATALLCAMGWIFLTSASAAVGASAAGDSWYFSRRQLAAFMIGAFLAWFVSRLRVEFVRAVTPVYYAACLFLLVLVLFVGYQVGGQRNWIPLPAGLSLQPSEYAKLGLVLMSAAWIWNAKRIGWSQGVVSAGLMGIAAIVVLLVIAEGDFGTPIILAAIALAILLVAGTPARWLWTMLGGGALFILMTLAFGSSYRFKRFYAWLNPEAYSRTDAYQLMHGKFALADGGWFGQGFGSSSEKWGGLPAPHTDFILPIIGQENGVLGTAAVLLPLFVCIAVAFQIADAATDDFERMVAFGIAAWLSVQSIINIGGVTGLLPITGVPLPFVSYGGSSVIPLLMGIGFLLGIARHNGRVRRA